MLNGNPNKKPLPKSIKLKQGKILKAIDMVTQTKPKTNRKEQAERIREYLKWNWQSSDREIARQLGTSHPTIAKYRQELETEGQILPRF